MIDSPGVREFGQWHLDAEQITHGFVEFPDYLAGANTATANDNDPGCAIREAVEKRRNRRKPFEKTIAFWKAWRRYR